MSHINRLLLLMVLALALAGFARARGKSENLILITLDGARTQEIFGGLDLEVLQSVTKKGAVTQTPTYQKYWAATREERRAKLMPFFWNTLMTRHGSVAGDRERGSVVQLTNEHRFSYPGYAEILTGQAHDDVINSNDRKRNPYPTVLEFLQRKLQLDARGVAAFASWDVMNWIAAHKPGAFTSNAGFEEYAHPEAGVRELSRMQFETDTPWDSVRHDAYTFRLALAHLKTYQSRVLYLALGETDDWAHDARYDRTLEALTRTDTYLRELWEYLQSQERYRDKTTLLITVDHGRGVTAADWTQHGKDIEGAQYTWLAVAGPDSALRGAWGSGATIYQNQIAATMCQFLGLDFAEHNRQAGQPIRQFFGEQKALR